MRGLFVVFLGAVLAVSGCGGDKNSDAGPATAEIVDFTWDECYCCPGVTLEIDGEQHFVDEFPDFELKEEDLPRSVFVELSNYSGTCNRTYSALYHD